MDKKLVTGIPYLDQVIDDYTQKFSRVSSFIKYGVIGLFCLVIAPFVFSILKGIVGLVAVVGVIGLSVWAAPLVANKLANLTMSVLMKDASVNPIETLNNQVIKRREQLQLIEVNLRESQAEKERFGRELREFAESYPSEGNQFADHAAAFEQELHQRRQDYSNAVSRLHEFESEVEKAGAVWRMAQATHRMTALTGNAVQETVGAMLENTSLRAINDSLDSSMAALKTSQLKRTVLPNLESSRKVPRLTQKVNS